MHCFKSLVCQLILVNFVHWLSLFFLFFIVVAIVDRLGDVLVFRLLLNKLDLYLDLRCLHHSRLVDFWLLDLGVVVFMLLLDSVMFFIFLARRIDLLIISVVHDRMCKTNVLTSVHSLRVYSILVTDYIRQIFASYWLNHDLVAPSCSSLSQRIGGEMLRYVL